MAKTTTNQDQSEIESLKAQIEKWESGEHVRLIDKIRLEQEEGYTKMLADKDATIADLKTKIQDLQDKFKSHNRNN